MLRNLQKKGFKVIVLDKKKFPRYKACGGLISSKALQMIENDDIKILLSKIKYNPVHKILLTSPRNNLFFRQKNVMGIIIRRKEFDETMIDLAVDQGATFIDNCEYKYHVTHKSFYEINTTRGIIESDYLIGADGVYSQVANVSGLRDCFKKWEMGLAVSCEVPRELLLDYDGIEFTFIPILGGMGWSFCGRDFVNMGVGGYAPDSKRVLLEAKKLFNNRIKNKYVPLNLKAAFLPAGGRRRRVAKERMFLIGDAAGFVDAFSGEGIYYALTSAKIATEVILKNKTAIEYQKQCYNIFLNEFRISIIMSIILGERRKILQKGIDKQLLKAFNEILTTPPEMGCYRNFIYNIIKRDISPTFPFLWIKSLFFG